MRFYTNLLGKLTAPLFGTGIGRLPLALPLFHLVWRIFGAKGTQLVNVQGFKLYTDPDDAIIAPQLCSTGCWEPFETEVFKGLIKPGMTVVDIGANIGYYTLMAAKLVGEFGKVYAFEPFSSTYEILRRNIEVNNSQNIIPIRKAVMNKNGSITLYLSDYSPTGNSITGKGESVMVPCTTLDDALDGTKVDVIKMDIEGAEALAFKGMQRVLSNSPDLILVTEVFPKALQISGSSLNAYVEDLSKWFTLKVIEEKKHRLTSCETLADIQRLMSGKRMVNMVCTRRK